MPWINTNDIVSDFEFCNTLNQNWTPQRVQQLIERQPRYTISQLEKDKKTVRCKECKHLMFSDCYGECAEGYRGIVQPDDYCKHGERRAE